MDEEMVPLLILFGVAVILGIIIEMFGKDILEWGAWFLR